MRTVTSMTYLRRPAFGEVNATAVLSLANEQLLWTADSSEDIYKTPGG